MPDRDQRTQWPLQGRRHYKDYDLESLKATSLLWGWSRKAKEIQRTTARNVALVVFQYKDKVEVQKQGGLPPNKEER